MGETSLVPPGPSTPPAEKDADIKVFPRQEPLVQPATITPTQTLSESSGSDAGETMAGKKIASLEKPDDAARDLVKKLTLEEQVWILFSCPKRNFFFFLLEVPSTAIHFVYQYDPISTMQPLLGELICPTSPQRSFRSSMYHGFEDRLVL